MAKCFNYPTDCDFIPEKCCQWDVGFSSNLHKNRVIKINPAWSVKSVIQYLNKNVNNGNFEACFYCNGMGRRSCVDASGNNDWDDCSVCNGWSVLKVVK